MLKILVINPGSTSTKIALFEDELQLWSETQRYETEELDLYPTMEEQESFRFGAISSILEEQGVALSELDAVVGRGGLLRPLEGGTYAVNQNMIAELLSCEWGTHASNLGGPLAYRFAHLAGNKPAFIVDPVVVDEMTPEAHLSGLPDLPRRSIFHALNQKAVAYRAAAARGGSVADYNFIVVHMGGGVSVGAHRRGRVIDVNDALGGTGPMSPERAGSLSGAALTDLCFSGKHTHREINKMLVGAGGFVAHLGTNNFLSVEQQVNAQNEEACLVFDAFVLQVGKEIGGAAVALQGEIDAILLTGGLAYSDLLCRQIRDRVAWIAPVEIFPGEDEMRALAEGVLRVFLCGEAPKQY